MHPGPRNANDRRDWRISIEQGKALFVERTVIVDMFSVPTMLSTPI
jgi:hypothetical protein